MTIVYVLSVGSYDDEQTVGVFSSVTDASNAVGGGFEPWSGQWIRGSRFDYYGDYDGISGIEARILPMEMDIVPDLSDLLIPGPNKRARLGL